jgi:cellulose synthase operon protein C
MSRISAFHPGSSGRAVSRVKQLLANQRVSATWKRSGLAVCVLAGLLGAVAARACFFGAPWQLLDNRTATLRAAPANTFAWEVSHFVAASAWFVPSGELPQWFANSDEERAHAEAIGLDPAQQAAVLVMRATPDAAAAFAAAGSVPAAVRLYTAGAVAFGQQDFDRAASYFAQIPELPPEQAASRIVWAHFMLGRIAAMQQRPDRIEPAYAAARTSVMQGAPDPLHLAVASFGESARLRLDAGDLPGAIVRYAEQAADGSDEAVQSLRIVAEDILQQPDLLAQRVRDPWTQRLMVTYALGLTGDYLHRTHAGTKSDELDTDGFGAADGLDLGKLTGLLDAIERSGIAIAEVDRLAALAYRLGLYPRASRLAEASESPLALWVQAKIALQVSRYSADPPALFARALHAAERRQTALDPDSVRLLRGETALAILTRGDFVQAATVLWPVAGTYWGDFAYLAERILTTDELKSFVQANAPHPAPVIALPEIDAPNRLRRLLARRLMRDGRYDEAVPFFDRPVRDERDTAADARAFAVAARRGHDAFWATDRARGGWAAAVLLRTQGLELTGTETAPDHAAMDGELPYGYGPPAPSWELEDDRIGVHAEVIRYDTSRPRPDLRFHYRYLATERALAAADELPPRSQAFAAILCQASAWMIQSHADERAWAIYLRYVERGAVVPFATHFGQACPEPDFAAVQATRWKLVTIDARAAIHGRKWAVGAAGGCLMLIAAAFVVFRARRGL